MATFNKFNQFIEDVYNGVHNFSSDQFTIALTNTAPVAGNSVLADLTQITYTNLSARDLTTSSEGQTGGNWAVLFADLVLSASGGAVGPFRYVVIYNNTPTSPADPLVGWYDYGSALTLADGESLTVDFTTSSLTAS